MKFLIDFTPEEWETLRARAGLERRGSQTEIRRLLKDLSALYARVGWAGLTDEPARIERSGHAAPSPRPPQ